MHQLVGADRDDAGDVLQGCVVAGGQRLLDELDACRLRCIEQALEVGGAPCLVGIGDEPRLGHGVRGWRQAAPRRRRRQA